ncbi:MAG: LUD domain-containing protein [Armatimonadota bacterium]|nr:LUD domain-containing protein [Armatimonadota bacterium]MDR7485701.1 LUD domain-containing protein [Armatimonadota bacterium]MDR7533094.1 LUD domain-containing protein [Armatimonadota bacterium]MDR7535874.1 LUD domain-containing protein [Armatimonadota bacterium]
MSREIVLGRVRAALHAAQPTAAHGAPGPAPAAALPALPRAQSCADPVALFVERGRAVAATVEVCASAEEATARAVVWLAARQARRIVAWDDPEVAPIAAHLAAGGLETMAPGAPVEVVAQADAGLTGAAWGIAESASLVLPADARRPRLFSLLPPLHVAVLRADRILPDLPALFERLAAGPGAGAGPAAAPAGAGAGVPAPLPSALTFITGPSRSADIGLVPVQGAHGPVEVAVFVLAGSPPADAPFPTPAWSVDQAVEVPGAGPRRGMPPRSIPHDQGGG